MTNNFSLFATKYIITGNNFLFFLFFFFDTFGFIQPQYFKDDYLFSLFATYGIIWFRKQQFFLKTTKKY